MILIRRRNSDGVVALRGRRIIGWFSCGAASAVALKLALDKYPNLVPVYCQTGTEHEDNIRFMADCEKWFGKPIASLKSSVYKDAWDVWVKRNYLAGVRGAPCSVELKIVPRLAFQRPTDIHIFGYTADATDVFRANRFRMNFPELDLRTPLIDEGINKAACFKIISNAKIGLPIMYELGFHNNNCIPCVKATSPAYWALVRKRFPDEFARMARLSRKLKVRLCRIKNVRMYIDEIPEDHPTTMRGSVGCDFVCQAAARAPRAVSSVVNVVARDHFQT